jgi:hypothetical protein
MFRRITLFLALLGVGYVGIAVPEAGWSRRLAEDSLALETQRRVKQITRSAAIFPGAGAWMNGKYWKVPIIWTAVGAGVWNIQRSTASFRSYRDAFIAETDGDPTTQQNLGLTAAQLNDQTLLFRRRRDLAWMALAGVHVLSILDAHVDAQLAQFDVGPNLKAWWQIAPGTVIFDPAMHLNNHPGWVAQVGIRWTLPELPQIWTAENIESKTR